MSLAFQWMPPRRPATIQWVLPPDLKPTTWPIPQDVAGVPVVAGPPGRAGAGFQFVQAQPSPVWTIPHNLDFRPTVAVVGVGGMEIEVEVQHLSNQTLEIRFVNPTAGTARLN